MAASNATPVKWYRLCAKKQANVRSKRKQSGSAAASKHGWFNSSSGSNCAPAQCTTDQRPSACVPAASRPALAVNDDDKRRAQQAMTGNERAETCGQGSRQASRQVGRRNAGPRTGVATARCCGLCGLSPSHPPPPLAPSAEAAGPLPPPAAAAERRRGTGDCAVVCVYSCEPLRWNTLQASK